MAEKWKRELEAKAVCLNTIISGRGQSRVCGIKFYGPHDELKGGHCPRCGHRMYVRKVGAE